MAAKTNTVPAETRTAEAGSTPANIAPATEFDPSGAPRQTPNVDPSHPAVDDNPRANTTEQQNRIDMNDPSKPGHEVVAEQLGQKTEKKAD